MIIAFCGAAGAGKSTAARALSPVRWEIAEAANALMSKDVFVHLPFAGILKEMLACIDPDLLLPMNKEKPHDSLCGKSPRYAMQTLGTEWGRELIGEGLWVMAWLRRAEQCPNVVVDDLRFPNEWRALDRLQATVIEVVRPGVERSGTHASETWTPPAHHFVSNTGDVEELHRKVRALVSRRSASERT